MLDEFKQEQPILYKLLTNQISNNKVSHAYLFETNGYKKYNEFLISFAKVLLCGHVKKEENCHICERIDKNIYSELKIINPDGMWIKKEQLLELQDNFKTKSIESNRKVYIINNAECLNNSSANSILKFLEEPADNIVAILVTNNIHQLLQTIVSRCQVLTMTNTSVNNTQNVENKIKSYLNIENPEEEIKQMLNDTIDYIYFYELNYLDTIIYNKNLVLNKFDTRDKLVLFLNIMLLFYKDVLDFKLKEESNFFEIKDLEKIANKNTLEKLQNKISLILNAKNDLKINANMNLLLDKLVIDLEGD